MGQTTGRALELLGLLQTGRTWSGAELQARFGVSARTLRRDMDRLRALGYGVLATPGVGGGYRLGPGESVPPLVLSNDEAMALAVGLRVGATAALGGLEEAAAGALGKLERSLASRTRHRLTTVRGAMVPADDARDGVEIGVVEAVADAVQESRRMAIDYWRHDGSRSRRQIEPHRLVHVAGRWYLVAWDVEQAGWRTLRLDRLTPRTPRGVRFTPRAVPDAQVRDFTSRSITTAPYRYRCRIVAHAPVEEVRTRFGPAAAQLVEDGADRTILTAGSDSLSEFAGYLATGGFEFTVLDDGDGSALRRALLEVADRLERAAAPSHTKPAGRTPPAGLTD